MIPECRMGHAMGRTPIVRNQWRNVTWYLGRGYCRLLYTTIVLLFYCSEDTDLPIVLPGGTLHCPRSVTREWSRCSWVVTRSPAPRPIVRAQSRVNDPIVRGQSRGHPHLDPLSVISHAWMTPLSAGSQWPCQPCQAGSPTVRTLLLTLTHFVFEKTQFA